VEDTNLPPSFKASFYLGVSNRPDILQIRKKSSADGTNLPLSFKTSFFLGVSNWPERSQLLKQQFSGGQKTIPFIQGFLLPGGE
jgi:hypothetical protein